MKLVAPAAPYLASYIDALERGWSADNVRGADAAREELEAIAKNADGFIDHCNGRVGDDAEVTLPDGSRVKRLPGYRRWMWDGEFCGSIGFRWQPETPALPAHVLGHIGYAVVPWKRRRGYATQALKDLLVEVRQTGLPWVELTTDPDNLESQKVISSNGGVLHDRFHKGPQYGNTEGLRFRITLAP